MNYCYRFVSPLACHFLIILFALGMHVPRAAGSQEVTGFYTVSNTTDLGSEVRVTLDIRLFNAMPEKLFITSVALLEVFPIRRGSEQPAAVVLDSNRASEFIQEFTLSRAEYDLWSRGMRTRLSIKADVGGQKRLLTALLIRRA
jgi:hypothetical protein